MTRDWLLTLLAMSPFFFAATIVVLGLTWQPIQNARARHAAKTSSPRFQCRPPRLGRGEPLDHHPAPAGAAGRRGRWRRSTLRRR